MLEFVAMTKTAVGELCEQGEIDNQTYHREADDQPGFAKPKVRSAVWVVSLHSKIIA